MSGETLKPAYTTIGPSQNDSYRKFLIICGKSGEVFEQGASVSWLKLEKEGTTFCPFWNDFDYSSLDIEKPGFIQINEIPTDNLLILKGKNNADNSVAVIFDCRTCKMHSEFQV